MRHFHLTSASSGSNIHRMKIVYVMSVLAPVFACVAQAQSEEELCTAIIDGLSAQEQLLVGVTDTASANAVVEALARNLEGLTALNEQADVDKLWLFIDNSPEIKLVLIECLQRLSVQYARLEKEQFFKSESLWRMLRPLLISSSAEQ